MDDFVKKGGFAAAGDACDHVKAAERNLDVEVFDIEQTPALDLETPLFLGAPRFGNGNFFLAAQVGKRERIGRILGRGQEIVKVAGNDYFAAMDSCARADIDDIVGSVNGVLIVLDNDNRIAEVAKASSVLMRRSLSR